MEEKELKAKDIPMGYALCFNDACNRKDTCMHYLAQVLTSHQDQGDCPCYCEKKLIKKAWGFSNLYDNVPRHKIAEVRQCVRSYFSAGMGPYYRVHHGENMLTPSNRKTSCKYWLNSAVPMASNSTTTKQTEISNYRKLSTSIKNKASR